LLSTIESQEVDDETSVKSMGLLFISVSKENDNIIAKKS
jgi:hypothetical protein